MASELDRLRKLLWRAADRSNEHESEIAGQLADKLARSLPDTLYIVPAGTKFFIMPLSEVEDEEAYERAKVLTLQRKAFFRETSRLKSSVALAEGMIPFVVGERGQYALFVRIREVTLA